MKLSLLASLSQDGVVGQTSLGKGINKVSIINVVVNIPMSRYYYVVSVISLPDFINPMLYGILNPLFLIHFCVGKSVFILLNHQKFVTTINKNNVQYFFYRMI